MKPIPSPALAAIASTGADASSLRPASRSTSRPSDRSRARPPRRCVAWVAPTNAGAALLADPDAEIRRAAVRSIAALGDVDALPTLVRLAKEDADGRVRAAALEAVERLSKPK